MNDARATSGESLIVLQNYFHAVLNKYNNIFRLTFSTWIMFTFINLILSDGFNWIQLSPHWKK